MKNLNDDDSRREGIVQGEGNDTEMTEAQQGEQVVKDTHVTISTVPKKTEVSVTSSSRSFDLESKFLIFLDIPQTDAEIVSPLDVHVHHEVPRTQAPTLLTIPVSVIPESSPVFTNIPQSSHTFTPTPIQATPTPPPTIETTNPLSNLPDFSSVFRFNDRITALEKRSYTRLGETREEFMNFLSESLTARIKEQVKDQLPQILPQKVSNFTPLVIEKFIKESCDEVTLAKVRKDKDKDEDPFIGSNRGLKKRKTRKDVDATTGSKKKDWTSGSSKGTKFSSRKSIGKLFNQEGNQCGDYPFDLSKPLPLITRGKRQRVPFEFFINNDLKYLQGGISTMTYTTSTTKTKAVKYDLPGIEDMVPNIWSPVKVAYDKYALWGISHWREQRKSFYAYARGMQSRGDVYSTKRILAVTHVSVMRKHGYGYLEEIVVRRADNVLYRFKEGDFSRLRINDIEDMLILVVQNRLTNLSGDDVADFAIALRMFTRSLVIQKRVEDLQLGVESYQK
ncbi:hypothetical protein Tco_0139313 [Tanacetum coccineum]